MHTQLKIQDSSGFKLAIHAARAGDVALLGAVIEEIFKLKVVLGGEYQLYCLACSSRFVQIGVGTLDCFVQLGVVLIPYLILSIQH